MYTYIIIDDEKLIRKGTIKKLAPLQDLICCAGEAENGADGIKLVEQVHPDIVILDMQMPGMHGTELLTYFSENYPDMPMIVISGYRDFDYIKHAISTDAIDYLLKPFSKETICETVRRAISRIESSETITRQITDSNEQKEMARYEYDLQYLTNLILGYHAGETGITSQKLKFINDTHRMALLTLSFDAPAEDFHIQEWLADGGFGDLALFLSGGNIPLTNFLILFLPNSTVITPENLIGQMCDTLIRDAASQKLSMMIGVSQIHSDLKELHTAFKEASSALDQQLLTDHSRKYFIYHGQSTPRQLSWPRENEFLFRIEAGMGEEVSALTKQLFTWFTEMSSLTLDDAKYYCYYLSGQCHQIINYYMKQEGESQSGSMQNIVRQMFRLDELEEYYRHFFMNTASLLKGESIYAIDDVISRVQIYIQHNYQKDLTQDFVASLFYLNRSYLSTLFRQKTGMKFIDYLNEIRIEKAMDMLSGTSRRMYQISKAVGYDNPKYFFRIFKKKTGMTPDQYRTIHGENI